MYVPGAEFPAVEYLSYRGRKEGLERVEFKNSAARIFFFLFSADLSPRASCLVFSPPVITTAIPPFMSRVGVGWNTAEHAKSTTTGARPARLRLSAHGPKPPIYSTHSTLLIRVDFPFTPRRRR